MRGDAVRPPRLATALLRLSLPKGVVRDTVLGDFWELHRRRAIVGSSLNARLWYWRQALGLSTRTLFGRLRRGTDGMPAKTAAGASPSGGSERREPPDDPRRGGSVVGVVLEAFIKDVRYAGRTLAATPGFALVAVATLGIGIGAATLMFSTLDGVVLRQLPYEDPGNLVSVASLTPRGEPNSSSAVDYLDYRARASSFQALAAVLVFSPGRVVTGEAEPERVRSTMVSANFFSMLGVDVAVGRTFAADEEVVGGPDVVILGHAYWQRRYGGDAGVVGESILIDGSPHQVIGVLPAQFWYPKAVDMWFPMRVGDGWTEGRGNRNFSMLGRLAPGVSVEQAGVEMSSLAAQLAAEYPDSDDGWGVGLTPLRSRFFGDTLPALLVLSLASGLFLVVACANLSSLVLARITTRRSELAVRAALGASRVAIVRQLVVESLLIALVGAAAGVLMAQLGLRAIRAFGPADLPRLETIALDGKVLAFTVLITVLSGLLFGLLPALRAAGQRAARQLREGTASASASSLRLRNALVVAQMGLSLTLLVGSGLLVRSFFRLTSVDPGFDPAGVITFQLQPPAFRYDSAEALDQFFTESLDRMASLSPDIKVSGTTYLPLMGGPWNEVHAADDPPADASEERAAIRRRVFEGYFETMRIPLLAGRTFERTDTEGAPPVVVISRRLAEEFFPAGDALGNVLMLPGWGEDGALAQQVIGIVDDVSDYGLGMEPFPVFYMPFRQVLSRSVAIALRTDGDPAAAIEAAREAIWAIDDDVPLADITLMATSLTESTAQVRFQTTLLALFAAAALFMSAMGLYGVLAFFVSQRGREVGVRMALGATSSDVIARVLRQGSVLVVFGLGLGLLGGMSAAYLLQSMLFETGSFDLLTYAVVSGVLLVAALGASVVPALRASRVDPVQMLRSG